MALPTRCFKLGFNLWYDQMASLQESEIVDMGELFRFVARGMKCYYKCLDSYRKGSKLDESLVERLPNGTWTGVVGLLNRSEVDYAPAELLLTEERWDAMSYNYPYAIDELVFATRNPEYSPETMAMFRTLSSNVWSSLLACIVLVILACFVAMKRRCTLGDILLHVFAIGLNQEGNLVPRRAGEVMLLSTWLGAMAVFTFCFKSVLLSFLTFPPVGGVRTVPELAAAIRAGQYSAFTDDTDEFATYLIRSPNEDLRVIGDSILQHPSGLLFALIDNPNKAFVHRRSILQSIGKITYVSKDNMGSLYFATAVSKDFCCKDEMDMLVHRYLAFGINVRSDRVRYSLHEMQINYLFEYYASDNVLSYINRMMSPETNRKLTLTDLSGAFILLVAGHCLSLCVFIFECWKKRRERRRLSPRNKQSGSV